MFWNRVTDEQWANACQDPFEVGLAIFAYATFVGIDPMSVGSQRFSELNPKKKMAWLRVAQQLKQQTERAQNYRAQAFAGEPA